MHFLFKIEQIWFRRKQLKHKAKFEMKAWTYETENNSYDNANGLQLLYRRKATIEKNLKGIVKFQQDFKDDEDDEMNAFRTAYEQKLLEIQPLIALKVHQQQQTLYDFFQDCQNLYPAPNTSSNTVPVREIAIRNFDEISARGRQNENFTFMNSAPDNLIPDCSFNQEEDYYEEQEDLDESGKKY